MSRQAHFNNAQALLEMLRTEANSLTLQTIELMIEALKYAKSDYAGINTSEDEILNFKIKYYKHMVEKLSTEVCHSQDASTVIHSYSRLTAIYSKFKQISADDANKLECTFNQASQYYSYHYNTVKAISKCS